MRLKVCHAGSLAALAISLSFTAIQTLAGDAAKRPFTVRDSIEMSYFGTLWESQPDDLDDDGIVSPDGRFVVKVTHRGLLPSGVTEGTIWRFDAVAMRQSVNHLNIAVPEPIPLLRMSAAVNGIDLLRDRGNVIHQLKWSDDSRSILFLGRHGQENRQIFRVEVDTGKVDALTPANQDVVDYSEAGTMIVYLAAPDRRETQEWVTSGVGLPDITAGTGSSLVRMLFPNYAGDKCCIPVEWELWRLTDGIASPISNATTHTTLSIQGTYRAEALSLSNHGGYLVTIAYQKTSEGEPPLKYQVVDLRSGTTSTLVDAPVSPYKGWTSPRYRAQWSPDDSEIALSNLWLPAGTRDGGSDCAVGVVSTATRQLQCIAIANDANRGHLYSFLWNPAGNQLRVRYRNFLGKPYEDAFLDRHRGAWRVAAHRQPPLELSLELSVREGLNDPPVLLATDPSTSRSRVVFDPNPQLKDKELGSVSVYEWKDGYGRTVQAGLVKPPGFVPGHRYPLVIQTHGFNADQFYRVGASDTASAGRALAGRGMVVLQVDGPYEPFDMTWQDGQENGTKVYLAAIDRLAAQGIIDPKRVGITGYSHAGLLVSTAITGAPDRFAAAALSNTDNGSLMDYYTYLDAGNMKLAADIDAGEKPYGRGIQAWLDRAPGFATDKIQAPVLISAADPYHLIELWSLYASLRDQSKPVELQYIRTGLHNITKPLQRFAHEEMLVDWFDFWLSDHQDSDPAKAAQYERWMKLREERYASQRETQH